MSTLPFSDSTGGLPAHCIRPPADPDDLAARIQAEHAEVLEAARSSVVHAYKAGALLLEAKRRVPHGSFTSWVEENCGFVIRTAQRYVQVARFKEESGLDIDSKEFLDGASKILSGRLRLDPPGRRGHQGQLSGKSDAPVAFEVNSPASLRSAPQELPDPEEREGPRLALPASDPSVPACLAPAPEPESESLRQMPIRASVLMTSERLDESLRNLKVMTEDYVRREEELAAQPGAQWDHWLDVTRTHISLVNARGGVLDDSRRPNCWADEAKDAILDTLRTLTEWARILDPDPDPAPNESAISFSSFEPEPVVEPEPARPGIPGKKPRLTDDQKARIVAMDAEGKEQREIAEAIGCSQSTVSSVLKGNRISNGTWKRKRRRNLAAK